MIKIKQKKKALGKEQKRIVLAAIAGLIIIFTGILFFLWASAGGDIYENISIVAIALVIIALYLFVFHRARKDIREGYPHHDERSRRVMEKATSKAFFISLYMFLIMGFFSDDIIHFRDVSQATGVGVGIMGLLFVILWFYYNLREI